MLAGAEVDELRVLVERAICSLDAVAAAVTDESEEAALDDLFAARLLMATALMQISRATSRWRPGDPP